METLNILLIEDRAGHAELIGKLLEADEQAYELCVRSTLEAGLERLSESEMDLVLLDLDLPDSHGEETFQTVYAAAPSVPIVILTGLDDEMVALKLVKEGAQDYLLKSQTDRQTLSRAVRYAIERKNTQENLRRSRDDLELRVAERTESLRLANAALEKEVLERRRTESALRESNRQLGEAIERVRDAQGAVVQRERLHALGLMARGLVHHLNNALSPLLGFSDMLLRDPGVLQDREKSGRYLQMINTAARESARLLTHLDKFHRDRDHRDESFERVELAEVLEAAVAVTEYRWRNQALGEGISIAVERDYQTRPAVSGNASELIEALSNLIVNAADAMPKDGTIFLTLDEDLGQARVVIRDTGSGMPEAVRAKCLEPFFSTKGEGGSGLGLGLVYGIVSRHGGTIEIESAADRGTSVTVILPPFAPKNMDTPVEKPAASPESSARILVVDDEMLVREVLQAYLENDGHAVTVAEDGAEALRLFAPGRFDIVLTDRAMPEMTGAELAVAIKAQCPQLPIVLLTGFGDSMIEDGEKLPGVDYILPKPFSTDSIRNILAQALARP